jgi:site-specific recombinase XerD
MGEITLAQALEEFKTIYMPARNLADRTRVEYANDLKGFIDYLATVGVTKAGELYISHIDRYLAKLDDLGFSGSTRKRKAITFRSFLSFLFRNGYISHDISGMVILPFPEHTIPRVLTQSEYQKLLQACENDPRDKALITLLLQTGIRLSELTRLKTSDVHLPDVIEIASLGSHKGRIIPLNSKACEALQGYFEAKAASSILFPSRTGKPIGSRGVEKLVLKYYRLAHITGATVHSLRHTFVVQHLIKGTSLKTIMEVAGHTDIRTTERYIPLVKELAKKELEANAL